MLVRRPRHLFAEPAQRPRVARPAVPATHSKPISVSPEEAAIRIRRALALAEHSPPWLPDRVAHADWGTALAKRAVASAELQDGAFRAHAFRSSSTSGDCSQAWDCTADGPAHCSGRLPNRTPTRLRRAGPRERVRQLAADAPRRRDAVRRRCRHRRRLARATVLPAEHHGRDPRDQLKFREALGLSAADVLRRCDRRHCARNAASEMFWCLGASGVGKATGAGHVVAWPPDRHG